MLFSARTRVLLSLFSLLLFVLSPLFCQRLIIKDSLQDSTVGIIDGAGKFYQSGGWKSTGGKIIYDAGHAISNGWFEATMEGWSAPAQGTAKSHPLAGWEIENQYTRIDQQGSYFNWRIGENYFPFKVLAKPIVGGTRLEARVGDVNQVNDGQPHRYRVEWSNGRVTFTLDGVLLISWQLSRFQLRCFTLGRDDWYGITNPAPIISDIRIIDRNLPPSDTLRIQTSALASGHYLEFYSDTLKTTEDHSAHTWTLNDGFLPQGLTLETETGLIEGIPLASGQYDLSFIALPSETWILPDTATLAMVIQNQPPHLISKDTVRVMMNQVMADTVHATDPEGHPVTYQLIDAPAWITGTDSTATGTAPDTPQDTSCTWTATDGDLSDTLVVQIQVMPAWIRMEEDSLPDGTYLTPYRVSLQAVGGFPPYNWNLEGALPRGLSFHPDSALIEGTPLESGRFDITLMIRDSWTPPNQFSSPVRLNIDNTPPRLFFPDTVRVTPGEPFYYPLPVEDAEGHPITIQLQQSPSWLSLGDNALSGSPSMQISDTTFTLELTDGDLTSTYPIYVIADKIDGTESDDHHAPVEFDLKQNFPNPMNPETVIEFSVPEPDRVQIKLFNAKGERVGLITDRRYSRGTHRIRLNGRNLSAGVYYYTLETGKHFEARKLILLK